MLKIRKQLPSSKFKVENISSTPIPILFNAFESSSSACSFSHSSGSSTNSSSSSEYSCHWDGCDNFSEHVKSGLLSHIQDAHVAPQITLSKRRFTCLWKGCKVYGQPSVSSNWLSNHILCHSEARGKPFPCIFDRCPLRFPSATLLERHIRRKHEQLKHRAANMDESLNLKISSSRHTEFRKNHSATVKSCSRKIFQKRKKFRYYKVRRTDFYDFRSKTIIKNRLMLDKIISECDVLDRVKSNISSKRNLFQINRDNEVYTISHLSLPLPIVNSSSLLLPEKRTLRSSGLVLPISSETFELADKAISPEEPDKNRIKLLLTVPHTFVGQRISSENKTEYLVRWQGDLCQGTQQVVWVQADEVLAAAHIDNM